MTINSVITTLNKDIVFRELNDTQRDFSFLYGFFKEAFVIGLMSLYELTREEACQVYGKVFEKYLDGKYHK